MRLNVFKSKIHRATVTEADLDYEGSVTIDEELMEAAAIHQFEAVHIWNVTRGTRLQTYALRGVRGSGVICINGAAAHLMKPQDLVIIATFAEMEPEEASAHTPTVVLVDRENRIVARDVAEIAGPARRAAAGRGDAGVGRTHTAPLGVRSTGAGAPVAAVTARTPPQQPAPTPSGAAGSAGSCPSPSSGAPGRSG